METPTDGSRKKDEVKNLVPEQNPTSSISYPKESPALGDSSMIAISYEEAYARVN